MAGKDGRPGGRTDDERHWPETDLVKRGRIAQRDETQSTGALYGELCDEIERLKKENEALLSLTTRAVLNDMREFNTDPWNDLEVKAFLDAYEKK